MNKPLANPETLLPRDDWPRVYRDNIVWDAHACLPLLPNYDMSALARHRAAGATYVSVNAGMDFNPLNQCIRVIAGFRDWIAKHSDHYLLVESLADITRAKREGKLGVSFDLEGSVMLEDDLAMLGLFRDLGVRQMHLAYNRDNSVAGGCHGAGIGLTGLGRRVVTEINRAGIILDCSHSSKATSLDVMELSSKPVVFSHANVKALCNHPRNIDDEQIKACAATGGIVAINGIGIFLGDDISTDTLLRHVDYVVEKVGVNHVGIGIDYSFVPDHSDLPQGEPPEKWWPPHDGYSSPNRHDMPPERLPDIASGLLRHGYKDADVIAIMGGNFMRVAGECWR